MQTFPTSTPKLVAEPALEAIPVIVDGPEDDLDFLKPTIGELVDEFEDETYGSVGSAICPTIFVLSHQQEEK